MGRLRIGISALTTLLLAFQTVGVAAHAHATDARQLAGVHCAADHLHGEAAAAPDAARGPVVRSGNDHVHDCIGCHLGSKRLRVVAASRAAQVGADFERLGVARPGIATAVWTDGHRSPRGPPPG